MTHDKTPINPSQAAPSVALIDIHDSSGSATTHLNWMGGSSFDIANPLHALRLAASSSFFGEPMYYQPAPDAAKSGQPERSATGRGGVPRLTAEEQNRLRTLLDAIDSQTWRSLSPAALMEQAIDAALLHDAEATLREAARLRQEEHLRTTPQVILVRAANTKAVKGTGLVTKYAPQIIRRADEPAVGMTYQMATYGKPIPNSLKKAWATALATFDAHQIAKYRGEAKSMRTADVVSLTHAHSPSLDALMQHTLRTTGETWEAIISERGSTVEAWTDALAHMGHMALLRNLRNLLTKGVPADAFLDRLVAGVAGGKQLPFRYYSAYQAVKSLAKPRKDKESGEPIPALISEDALAPVLEGLDRCLSASLANAPFFSGRVMSLCDNSGSAWGTTTSSMGRMHIAQIANLTGVVTGRRCDEGFVGIFGDRLETYPVGAAHSPSIMATVERLDKTGKGIGQNTENGIWLFWDQAIKERQHWDHVFVYSDMQAGHGGLYGTEPNSYKDYLWPNGARHYIDVPKLIAEYRKRVNPKVLVYLVQVAGYKDTIVPEFYDRTFILGGWGDGLLRFASEMAGMYSSNSS